MGRAAAARVLVVGLGPAGPELLTTATVEAIASAGPRYVRTSRHPAVDAVPGAESFDGVYESSASLDDVYSGIVERLVAAAVEHAPAPVLYAVPGSPVVAERSVELLLADGRVAVEVLPALSFADLAWARVGVDPVAAGVRLVDGHRFAAEAAGATGPLLVAQCDSAAVLSGIKLAAEPASGTTVVVLQRLGLPDERLTEVDWYDLDRVVEPDHLTSLYVPSLQPPVAAELLAFTDVVRTLREQCPWDREQDHRSLAKYLIEETYETVDAIEGGDPAELEEELGDLLYQVVFHAVLGAEEGDYTLADVARGITDKLVRRHPHVFGDAEAADADTVRANWEQLKKAEKGRASVMDGAAGSLPALMYARKVQQKARAVGFDWKSSDDVWAKVEEELAELRDDPSEDELGDVLFAVVNLARHLGVDAEPALRAATAKFVRRFQAMEVLADQRGVAIDDTLWDEVKEVERGGS